MFSKEKLKTLTASAFLVLCLFSDLSYGQSSKKDDYSYIEASKSFYKIHTTYKTWSEGKQVCATEGATLWYPENEDEARVVTSFWNTTQSGVGVVFVGLTDVSTEGVFKTIDGKSFSEVYNEWASDQPDDKDGTQDCIYLYKEGRLGDYGCEHSLPFICKKSLPSDGQTSKKDDYSYIEASKSSYKIHTTKKTWTEGKQVCDTEGATLWYPENDDEVRAVESFWNATQPGLVFVAVGLTDIVTEGVFKTIDGRSISEVYHKWDLYQPDDTDGTQGCLYFHKGRGFTDWGCENTSPFICKKSGLSTGSSLDIISDSDKPISEVYNSWEAGQPNNYEEDCVLLTKEGTYYTGTCDIKYPYICKKSLQTLKWDNNCNMSNLDYTFNKDIGKCYKFHTTPLNWAEAYAVCSAEQSYLAVITNGSEAEYLAKLTESAPEKKVKGNYLRGIYHLGFHNRFNEGWQTVKGTPLNYAEAWWGNYQPEADNREQCGAMFFNGLLTHINCDMRSFFICEHEGVNASSGDEENYM